MFVWIKPQTFVSFRKSEFRESELCKTVPSNECRQCRNERVLLRLEAAVYKQSDRAFSRSSCKVWANTQTLLKTEDLLKIFEASVRSEIPKRYWKKLGSNTKKFYWVNVFITSLLTTEKHLHDHLECLSTVMKMIEHSPLSEKKDMLEKWCTHVKDFILKKICDFLYPCKKNIQNLSNLLE